MPLHIGWLSFILYHYVSIPKMLSGYSGSRLAERAKIVYLCNARVYTGVGTHSGLGRGRMRLLGQSPSPEKTPLWRVILMTG
jgi:hypothetical protein